MARKLTERQQNFLDALFGDANGSIKDGDWLEAAEQMQDSRWYKQVTNRADRLISRMRAIGLS